jgi:hypothetical protein
VSPDVAAAVIVSADRKEFDGDLPEVGDSFTSAASGSTYRIIEIEDLPSRPFLLMTCEASKAAR